MMQRIIRHITEHFVSQLPDAREFYGLEDLRSCNFPDFLVRRIHIELQWNLDESMTLPDTDWADTDSEAVQHCWQQFLDAIHAEVHLPAGYVKAVVETAVADVLEILIRPRRNITDILYEGRDSLTAAELAERTELLVVYPHFATVLNSYMARKDKPNLARRRCQKIIVQVDEKVTRQYTPLQWAHMLDPLFTLTGSRIDTELLRLFFEDRNMSEIADKFEMMGTSVTRSEFIEVLSSPDQGDTNDYQDIQTASTGGWETEKIEREPAPFTPDFDEKGKSSGKSLRTETEDSSSANKNVEKKQKDQAVELPTRADKGGSDDKTNNADMERDDVTAEPDYGTKSETKARESEDSGLPKKENEDEPASLNAIFSEEAEREQEPDEELPGGTNEPDAEFSSEEEDSSIWKQFMDTEAGEESREEFERDTSRQYEDDYLDEPLTDFTEENDAGVEKEELEQLLADDKSYFVDELFDGSERAYEKSLREIARKDTWKEASKLIEKNIFRRNMINIYSKAAVDFTDRLQDYFLDKQNKK